MKHSNSRNRRRKNFFLETYLLQFAPDHNIIVPNALFNQIFDTTNHPKTLKIFKSNRHQIQPKRAFHTPIKAECIHPSSKKKKNDRRTRCKSPESEKEGHKKLTERTIDGDGGDRCGRRFGRRLKKNPTSIFRSRVLK